MTPGLVRPLPKLEHPGTAAAFIAVGTSQLGYREGANNDNWFGKWYGANHEAWCCQYLVWVAAMSGCAGLFPKTAFTEALAQWFMAHDLWHEGDPQPGDVGFIWDPGMVSHTRPHGIHHTFGVKEPDGRSVITFEGNTNNTGSAQGNGVYSLRRTTRIRGYGRPRFAKAPAAQGPVNLVSVIRKAKTRHIYDGRVAAGLKAEGLAADLHGYASWQKRLHYTGSDADGIAGRASLSELGHRHGFEVA